MAWLQISVDVRGDLAEVVTEAFTDTGALSVTYLDSADEPILEPALGEHPLWTAPRVVALFPDDCDTNRVFQRLSELVPGVEIEPRIDRLEDRDWSSTWRESFRAMRFGTRLWVVPCGESAPGVDNVVVHMDPGLAFGTGTHATTALCLEWLDAHPPLAKKVIDYGCGSGILALAAAKLGARRVWAVDIDPQALQATRENARRNAMAKSVNVLFPAALTITSADLLVANILANPLIERAGTFAAYLADEGTIVLTGILEEQADQVTTAYGPWFDFHGALTREGWVLLEGVRRGKNQDQAAGSERSNDQGTSQHR